MKRMRFPAAMLLCLAACAAGASCERDATRDNAVTIFAAASTTDAVAQAIEAMPTDRGAGAVISAGASSVLATQVMQGAPADLFLSANPQWADEVHKHRRVVARVDLLGNRLVVIVPRDSRLVIDGPAAVAQPAVERLALGDPAAVPVGIYAKRALEASGVWSQVEQRVIIAADAPHALMLVETGAADAGIVYATDAAGSGKVSVAYEVAEDVAGPIVYPLLLLSDDEQSRRTFEWLQSPQAAAIFEHHGFMKR